MNTAALLIRRGERAQAIGLLEPLANDPHSTGLARAARRLLAEARGESLPAEPEADDAED